MRRRLRFLCSDINEKIMSFILAMEMRKWCQSNKELKMEKKALPTPFIGFIWSIKSYLPWIWNKVVLMADECDCVQKEKQKHPQCVALVLWVVCSLWRFLLTCIVHPPLNKKRHISCVSLFYQTRTWFIPCFHLRWSSDDFKEKFTRSVSSPHPLSCSLKEDSLEKQ